MNKIKDFCSQNGIKFFIVNTPLHSYYKRHIPLKFINKYGFIVHQNGVNYIDFSELQLNDSCFIPDGDHVSVRGAKLASESLKPTE